MRPGWKIQISVKNTSGYLGWILCFLQKGTPNHEFRNLKRVFLTYILLKPTPHPNTFLTWEGSGLHPSPSLFTHGSMYRPKVSCPLCWGKSAPQRCSGAPVRPSGPSTPEKPISQIISQWHATVGNDQYTLFVAGLFIWYSRNDLPALTHLHGLENID